MQTYSNISDVIALAEFAHRNQTDKAGLPYIEHPKRVMESVKAQGLLPFVQMGAVLHDVIEDTAFTEQMLLDLGVPAAAVEIVVLLTKIPGQPNTEYYANIRKNNNARLVKLADVNDNSQEWRLSYLPPETKARLIKKYHTARMWLTFCEELDNP